MNITKHFTLEDIKCPCCDALKIIPALYRHLDLLEQLQDRLKYPIIILSGYRCVRYNAQHGGSPRSWHLVFATDIKPAVIFSDTMRQLRIKAYEVGFTGVGIGEDYIHLDLRPEPLIWRI